MRYLLLVPLLLTPLTGEAQSPERIGELRYRRLIDHITDADRSLIYTAEVNAREVQTGRTVAWIGRAIWRCQGKKVEVILRADSLPADGATVRWRVDDHPPSPPELWTTGASGVSVFAPHASAERLTAMALRGERMIVRVRYDVGGDFDYDFNLEGAEDAIGRLACAPVDHTDAAPHDGNLASGGTTRAVRGSYKRNSTGDTRWAQPPDTSFAQRRDFSS